MIAWGMGWWGLPWIRGIVLQVVGRTTHGVKSRSIGAMILTLPGHLQFPALPNHSQAAGLHLQIAARIGMPDSKQILA